MLKVAHQAVMVINDDSPCTDVNEVRDPDNGYCYGLMSEFPQKQFGFAHVRP